MNSIIPLSNNNNLILENNQFKCSINNIGLYSIHCNLPVNKVVNKLESILKNNDMTIFNRIDHAAGAKKVGIIMKPTELLIFGNPNVGSLLMEDNPTIAIDLPQKIMVTQNKDNKKESIIYFNDPVYIAKRHGVFDKKDVIENLKNILLSLIFSLFKVKNNIL